MTNANRGSLQVVTTCRAADLKVLQLAADGLHRHLPLRQLSVITARRNFRPLRKAFGKNVELLDEDAVIPGMTLNELRKLSLPGFPGGAGWYFQQLLKLAIAFRQMEDDYYLIWDADTVPLRPLHFFDETGRMLFTIAEEEHQPYLESYRKLLREEPNREFSFIAQHMIVQKSIAREMLAKIESNFAGTDSWAWKIMRNLEGPSGNLFSEYEALGHFVKNHYPLRAAYRRLNWLRGGALKTRGLPSQSELQRLSERYDFVAFESAQMPLRKFVRRTRNWLRSLP
jgi:hypothetical protein